LGGLLCGKTKLMEACEKRDTSAVSRLLENDADVHERDSTGRSALMFAARSACVDAIKALIRHGADVESRNCAGHSCLHFAVGAGLQLDSRERVEQALQHLAAATVLLDEGAPVNAATGYGLTALMLACASGRMNMIELLLSRGADPRATSDIGLTALSMAADKGNADVVKRLLRASAEPDSRHGSGKTPLMGAAALAHASAVTALLEGRANANAVSEDGHSPLFYAVEKGLKDGLVCPIAGDVVKKADADATVLVLLEAAADPNHVGPLGRTPLHVACVGGSIALVERLVSAGAGLNIDDDDGETPAQIAQRLGHSEVLWVLRSYGGSAQESLRRVISQIPSSNHGALQCPLHAPTSSALSFSGCFACLRGALRGIQAYLAT
jgi:ankyrin repeat protein